MASSADNMVRDAIKAYHGGNVVEARNLLLQAVEVDEASEQAWLWLSAVVESDQDKLTCLENVLTINPNNEKAKQGLRIINEKSSAGPSAPSPAPQTPVLDDDDPFASVSFTEPAEAEPEPSAPFAADDDDELPEVAWGSIETSSASAVPSKPEPGPAEYEDWINNLNIGGNDAVEIFGDAVPGEEGSEESEEDAGFAAAPFIGNDDVFDGDDPFEVDDSIFGLDDDAFQDAPDIALAGSPFSADIDSDFPEEEETPPPPPASNPAAGRTSPVPRTSPTPKPQTAKVETATGGADFGILDDDTLFDFDDTSIESLDPEEYFAYIPTEIKATRLPGTNQRYPPLLIVGLLLLFGLNIGAVFLVFTSLNGG